MNILIVYAAVMTVLKLFCRDADAHERAHVIFDHVTARYLPEM